MNCEQLAIFLENRLNKTVELKSVSSSYYDDDKFSNNLSMIIGWIQNIDKEIRNKNNIQHNTHFAVIMAVRIFMKLWKKVNEIKKVDMKNIMFTCYCISMKYLYDDIRPDYRLLCFKYTKKDLKTTERQILILLDWNIN